MTDETQEDEDEIELPDAGSLEVDRGDIPDEPQQGTNAVRVRRVRQNGRSDNKKFIHWGCSDSCCTTEAGSDGASLDGSEGDEQTCEAEHTERVARHARFTDFEVPKTVQPVHGSTVCLPACTEELGVGAIDEDAIRQTHNAKPKPSAGTGKAGRRGRWRHKKNLRKLELGEIERASQR